MLVGEEPKPEERASLPTEALLNATKIAKELGWTCKSNPNSFDARKVNRVLKEIGYQELIAGMWSATKLGKKHSDRKPVDTNSRTQKDQLFWKSTIIPIIQEWKVNKEIA